MKAFFTKNKILLAGFLLATSATISVAQNNSTVINPKLESKLAKYDYVNGFHDGLAAVLKVDTNINDKWGFVDTNGKEVIKCQYDKVGNFQNGFANVCLNGKYGIINTKGEEIVPCEFDDEIEFSNNHALVSIDNRWGIIDRSGKVVVPCEYDEVWEFKDNWAMVEKYDKIGLVDITGNEVVPCEYDGIGIIDDNWALVQLYDKKGLFSITNRTEVVPCKYNYVYPFSDDIAKVIRESKYGLINTNGEEIVPCEFDAAKKITDNLIIVQLNKKNGFYDTAGHKISECIYDQVYNFHDGVALVAKGNWSESKYGYINSNGMEIVPCQYDFATNANNGIAKIGFKKTDNEGVITERYNFINTQGNIIVPWDKYEYLGDNVEGFIPVKSNSKYGFINTQGEEVVPCKYESDNFDFEDGLVCVKNNGKWGFLNSRGEEVIPCTLDYAYSFDNGTASVISKGKFGTIDTKGNFISSHNITLDDVRWLFGSWRTDPNVKKPLFLYIKYNDKKTVASFFDNKKEIIKDVELLYDDTKDCYILRCTKKGHKDTNFIVDMDKMELIDKDLNSTLQMDGIERPIIKYNIGYGYEDRLDDKLQNDYEREVYVTRPMHRTPKPTGEEIFKSAATMPSFPGGDGEIMKYINKIIRYPQSAQDNGIQGKVILQFVVEKDGSIGEIIVIRGVDRDLDSEAVRVCKKLPRFNPGRNAVGDRVRVWYTLPITFMLQGDCDDYEPSPEPYNEIY